LSSRGSKSGVPSPALTALSHNESLTWLNQIGQDNIFLRVTNNCTGRHGRNEIIAVSALLIFAPAMLSRRSLKVSPLVKVNQGVVLGVNF
jgi:hypothetical protein